MQNLIKETLSHGSALCRRQHHPYHRMLTVYVFMASAVDGFCGQVSLTLPVTVRAVLVRWSIDPCSVPIPRNPKMEINSPQRVARSARSRINIKITYPTDGLVRHSHQWPLQVRQNYVTISHSIRCGETLLPSCTIHTLLFDEISRDTYLYCEYITLHNV